MGTPHQIAISIGGTSIRLNLTDPAFCEVLQQRYGGFIAQSGGFDYSMDVELTMETNFLTPQAGIRVESSDGVWRICRNDFEAEWAPRNRRGRVRQTAHAYVLDAVLRIVHGLLLADRGGFLLHSSSAVRHERAFLFSGISGVGKTTISRLVPVDALLLADEVSYVRHDGIAYRAYGTPFAGELAKAKMGKDLSAPLRAAYLLAHGIDNRIVPMSAPEAVAAMMRNVIFFARDPVLTKKIFNTVCDFVSKVEVSRLSFVPDEHVWDLIQ